MKRTAFILAILFVVPCVATALPPEVSNKKRPGAGQVFRDTLKSGQSGPELVVVPAGRFLMGDLQDEGYSFEHPVHEVVVGRAFALGRYELTFEDYDRFCLSTGRPLPPDQGGGRGRRPVINVSWRDARDYCVWLSGQTGEKYRLPSEAEWEYAARGGTRTSRYWGDKAEDACEHANVADAVAKELLPKLDVHACRDGFPYTAPVGSFQPNSYGLFDVLGNVWEWTLDAWHDTYRTAPEDGSKWSGRSPNRVRRGGSWYSIPISVRSAVRNGAPKGYRGDDTGFRVLRELKDAK